MTGGAGTIDCALKGRLGAFAFDVAFVAPGRGVTALFGPSGCGKTTVLRAVAGLERIRDARISVAGEVWQNGAAFLPPHRRPVGYVFQEASLFPHRSVRGNLLFGLDRARKAGARLAISLDEVVDLLGLDRLLERAPGALSGGERQRVAVGRALLSQPSLLLMDEPLSALDRPTKDEILPFLERLHETLALPILYVTHDLAEVERLADCLVLMEQGRVLASGPLAALQSDPALPLVARRDSAVSLDAVTAGYDARYGLLTLEVDGGRFTAPSGAAQPGQRRRITVQASDVSLALRRPHASTIGNVIPCRILDAKPLSDYEIAVVLGLGEDGAGARLLSHVTRRSWDALRLAAGQSVFAQVKSVALAPRPS